MLALQQRHHDAEGCEEAGRQIGDGQADAHGAAAGFAGAEVDLWFGLLGPAGLPAQVAARINAAMNDWLALPATGEQLRQQGMVPVGGEPAGFARLIAADQQRWARIIRTANIRAE